MIRFYNWLVCTLFKRCEIHTTSKEFKKYCDENPWACECKIYED